MKDLKLKKKLNQQFLDIGIIFDEMICKIESLENIIETLELENEELRNKLDSEYEIQAGEDL